MRYAVLSDIHSNLEALAAVLDALASERIDRHLCAGDLVGYGADPVACLERLRVLEAVMVAGNHDQACVGRLDLGWFNDVARAALLWTRDQLGLMDLEALRRLPTTATFGPCTLVHSSLKFPERFTYLVDAGQVVEMLADCRTLFCVAGHTHLPCVVEYDLKHRQLLRHLSAPRELGDVSFIDDGNSRRYFLNPGSVGQPRDGDPRASAAIIDTEARTLRVLRVPYDVAAAQAKIRRAGLPAFLADRLAIGR